MRRDAAILAAISAACLLWGIEGGKDLNSDLLHYHVYGPLSLLHGRVGLDFLPAGLQSYLNPLAHVPFYAMLQAGWHSVAIGGVLAAIHALALVLIYVTARALLSSYAGPDRAGALLCLLLGAASAPVLSAIGRVYTDIVTLLPVLAAVWIYCTGTLSQRPLAGSFALGLLLGVAAGLKQTNAIYAIAALAWPLFGMPGARLKSLVALMAGGACGAALSGGYWAWLLWKEFGNPVFPLFNAVFRSPDFPPLNLSFERFRPHDLAEFLMAPLRMALPQPMIYGEQTAPDIRPALLIALLILAGAQACLRPQAIQPELARPGAASAVPGFLAFYVVSAALWLATSFNARYGLGLLLLAGPAAGAALRALLQRRWFHVAMLGAVVAQSYWLFLVSPSRMTPSEPYAWTQSWLEYDVPERLRAAPHLFLAVETQSYSFLAAYVHPDSRFVNVRGGYALHLDGPGGARLARLMEENGQRLRVLGSSMIPAGRGRPPMEWTLAMNSILGRLGLEVYPGDCLPIRPVPVIDGLARAANDLVGPAAPFATPYPMSCGLRRVPVSASYLRGRAAADSIFDSVERACPSAFRSGLARSEQRGALWMRYYPDAERDLFWDGTEIFTVSRLDSTRSTVGVPARAGSFPSFRCP